MRRKQTVLHTAAAGLLSVCMALSLVGCPEIPGGGYVPPDSPVNSGSSEDSGETSGGGGGGTTSGPVVNDPTTWKVEGDTLSVPSGATSISAEDIAAVQGAQAGKTITSIDLPASVTTIEENAFSSCPSLTSINLGNVTTIGDNAFKKTNISGELNLSSATKIGEGAFKGCTGITGVTFGTDVTIAAGTLNFKFETFTSTGAFAECDNLTSVTFNGSANVGAYAFYNCNQTSVTFNGRADVGERAFYNCKLTTVTFNGRATIGEAAFGAHSMNTSLTSVTFKGSTEVGSMAFHNCTALKNVSGLDEVTSIGNSAFGDTGLTSVKLGAGLTTLEPNAFIGCNRLTSADLSACTKLDTIASGMFDSCTSLKAIFLSESIAQIGVEGQTLVFIDCNDKQVTVYTKRSEEQKITLGEEGDERKIASIVYDATEEQWKNALNGSSSGTPDGQSLLSSFSAFRDLLS